MRAGETTHQRNNIELWIFRLHSPAPLTHIIARCGERERASSQQKSQKRKERAQWRWMRIIFFIIIFLCFSILCSAPWSCFTLCLCRCRTRESGENIVDVIKTSSSCCLLWGREGGEAEWNEMEWEIMNFLSLLYEGGDHIQQKDGWKNLINTPPLSTLMMLESHIPCIASWWKSNRFNEGSTLDTQLLLFDLTYFKIRIYGVENWIEKKSRKIRFSYCFGGTLDMSPLLLAIMSSSDKFCVCGGVRGKAEK